ncbi:hypothetical protein [Portibacter lacus]|uniref:DUF4249 domain-containing protein n=1 Tax=Portibacter lacus TaxID=1099794 RepID=A0AA37SJ28_9BACT|nr:hypothetical protein [Portibacter lacus]GLR15698.1 hypothetical protein GCM10007940_03130 [Portibacter lacus]
MKFKFGFIALLFLVGSCSYFSDPGSELVLNVDNEFEIEMVEILEPTQRSLAINITLLDQFKCQDSELGLVQNISNNNLSIIIQDIITPPDCNDETSYPQGTATFHVNNNTYDLGIQVQEQVNQNGILQVSDKGYELDLSTAKGLIIDQPYINKIPSRFIWGYYQAVDSSEQEIIESFLLRNDYSTRPLTYMKPGKYSYFEIDEQGEIFVNDAPSSGIVKTLAFDLADLNEIKEVVSNFKATHSDINLKLFGSDGSVF